MEKNFDSLLVKKLSSSNIFQHQIHMIRILKDIPKFNLNINNELGET